MWVEYKENWKQHYDLHENKKNQKETLWDVQQKMGRKILKILSKLFTETNLDVTNYRNVLCKQVTKFIVSKTHNWC